MQQHKNMQEAQKRLYFQKIILFIIHIVIKNFIINLNYLIKRLYNKIENCYLCLIERKLRNFLNKQGKML